MANEVEQYLEGTRFELKEACVGLVIAACGIFLGLALLSFFSHGYIIFSGVCSLILGLAALLGAIETFVAEGLDYSAIRRCQRLFPSRMGQV